MKAQMKPAIAAIALIGLAACSGNKENNKKEDTTAQSDLAKIQAAGVLKVGITEYEPMNYKDKNGEWTGFDTEFAQALGEKLGKPRKWSSSPSVSVSPILKVPLSGKPMISPA